LSEGDDSNADVWRDIFGERTLTAEQHDIRSLMRAKADQAKAIQELKRELRTSRSQIRRLKNATVALLGPIMLGGIVAFWTLLDHADGPWEKVAVWLSGAFGVWWLRDVGRNFDEATHD
jgi:hypothetical protein